jgi:hypothetical protein
MEETAGGPRRVAASAAGERELEEARQDALWMARVEHDAALKEERAWWRVFRGRLEDFYRADVLPRWRALEWQGALARTLRHAQLPMPASWEAMADHPDRGRYWAWVYAQIPLHYQDGDILLHLPQHQLRIAQAERIFRWERHWDRYCREHPECRRIALPGQHLVTVLWWARPKDDRPPDWWPAGHVAFQPERLRRGRRNQP